MNHSNMDLESSTKPLSFNDHEDRLILAFLEAAQRCSLKVMRRDWGGPNGRPLKDAGGEASVPQNDRLRFVKGDRLDDQ